MYPFRYIPQNIEETSKGVTRTFHFRNNYGAIVTENYDDTFDIYLIWFTGEENYFFVTKNNCKYVRRDVNLDEAHEILKTIADFEEVII